MEEWVVETTHVAKWNQRKDSENDEKDDGMGKRNVVMLTGKYTNAVC